MDENTEIQNTKIDKQVEDSDDDILSYINPEYDIPIYISKYKKILVLSGGGIKGIAHIGVLKALDELKYLNKFEVFAGTSVGALIVGLYVIGYKPEELRDFILKFDLGSMKSVNLINILSHFGLDSGHKIDYVIKRLIKAKNVDPDISLVDLYILTRKKLVFTTVCLNSASPVYISYENFPTLSFYKAIRMSFSIPWFYTPVEHDGKLYIDGGCIDNYPIQHFKDQIDKVFGVYLVDTNEYIDKIENIETYTLRVFHCFMEGVNINSKKGFEKYTLSVHIKCTSAIAYGLSVEQKEELYKIGYNAMVNYKI